MSVQTINEKIELINTYKNNIKNAIKAKGVNVADTDKLEVYASKIALIEQNSGGDSSGGYTLEDMARRRFPSILNYPASIANTYGFCSTGIVEAYCENVTTLGISAFANCGLLTTLSLPKLSRVPSYCFASCFKLSKIELPEAEYVGSYAFQNCSSISMITLPKCSSLYNYAFSSCYNLMSLKLGSTSVCKLASSSTFHSTPYRGHWAGTFAASIKGQYGSIYVPMSLVEAYKVSTNWTYFSSLIVGY